MKRLLILFLTALPYYAALAQKPVQITNVGDEIVLKTGMRLHVKGSYIDSVKSATLFNGQPFFGTLVNGDTIFISEGIRNRSNKNLFVSDFGVVVLNGGTSQFIEGDSAVKFHQLVINKTGNVVPYQFFKVSDSLRFLKGYIFLDSAISGVDLGNFATVYEEAADKRFFGRMGKIIARNRNIAGVSNNIAGIGIDIEADGSLGATLIERQNGYHGGVANTGINRFYRIVPPNKNADLHSATIHYFDEELRIVGEPTITFWNSIDRGVLWSKEVTERDNTLNYARALNVKLGEFDNVFTLADSICNVIPQIDISPKESIAVCEGDDLELDPHLEGHIYLWNTGETTQKITVNTPGKYYVRVTNSNGCFAVDSISVIEKPYPDVEFDQTFVCQDAVSTFTNQSTLTDAAGTMTYHWDFGVTTTLADTSVLLSPDFTFPKFGEYQTRLRVTSDFNCIAELTKTYVVHPNPISAFSVSDNCFDEITAFTNASTIEPNIGAINYAITSYSWDFGDAAQIDDVSDQESPQYSYLQHGLYTATLITETNAGCTNSSTKDITVYPLPVPDFTFTNVCDGDSMVFVNNSSIATGTMTYAWDFGDGKMSTLANPKHKYSSFGSYNVKLVVTGDGNCQTEITKQVNVHPFPQASFTAADVCEGENIPFVNNSSVATGTLTYHWDFGDATTSTDEVPTKSYSTIGSYLVTLTVTSDKGCIHSASHSVTVAPTPNPDFSFVNACDGLPIAFTNLSTVATGQMSMLWEFGDGSISTFLSPNHKYAAAGDYTVKLTASNASGCTAFVEKTISVFELPVINQSASISTCDASILLDAENSGLTFLWSDNSTNQTLLATASGNYSVKVTNSNGCFTTKTIQVTLKNVLEDVLPATSTACSGVTLDAGNAGGTYLWSNGSTSKTVEITNSGTYNVKITDRNGCVATDQIEVTILPISIVDLGDDIEVCANETVILDAGVSGVDYLWSTGATTKTIEVASSGTYSVSITNAANCTSSDEINVVIRPMPIPNFTFTDVCEGSSTAFFNTSTIASGAMNLTWDLGNGVIKTGDLSAYKYSDPGTYDVNLTVTSAFGCEASMTKQVVVNQLPELSIPALLTTCGDQLTIDAGAGAASYNWFDGSTDRFFTATQSGTYSVSVATAAGCVRQATTEVRLQASYVSNLPETAAACDRVTLDAGNTGATYLWSNGATSKVISVTTSGTYTVNIKDQNGCEATDVVVVTVNPSPRVELGGDRTVCFESPVVITASSDLGELSYLWSTGATTPTIAVTNSREYSVTATSAAGCSSTASMNLTVNPTPVANFSVQEVCLEQNTTFRNSSTLLAGQLSFSWDFGDGVTSTDRNPNHTYKEAGDYQINLIATSDKGCKSEFSAATTVNALPILTLPSSIETCEPTLVLNAGNAGAKYNWSTNTTTQAITVSTSGKYGITVTNEKGCIAGKTVEAVFKSVYVDVLPVEASNCDMVELDAGNLGGTYSWSSGQTTQKINVTASQNLTVDITDKNGCKYQDQIIVIVKESPKIDLGADIELCSDKLATLSAPAGLDTYKWSDGSTTASITPKISGTYAVIGSKAGCATSDEITLTINPTPNIDLGDDRQACNEMVLDATLPNSTYLWSDGSTGTILTSTQSGQYWVQITSDKGCLNSDTVTITVEAAPILDFEPKITACSGEVVTLDALNEGAEYLWSTGATEQKLLVSSSGKYSVSVRNAIGCTIDRDVEVDILPKVDLNIGEDKTVCTGTNLTLNSNIDAAEYLWKKDGAPIGNEKSVTISATGQYLLEVKTIEGCLGTDTLSLQVSVDTVISRFLVKSEIRLGDTLNFRNISIPVEADYFWKFGDGVVSRQLHPQHIYLKTGVFNPELRVATEVCDNTSTKEVTVSNTNAGRIIIEDLDEEDDSYLRDEIMEALVFPNPFSSSFSVHIEKSKKGPLLLVMYDMNGKIYHNELHEDVDKIDHIYNFPHLPSGIYIISIRTNDTQVIRRIIKK